MNARHLSAALFVLASASSYAVGPSNLGTIGDNTPVLISNELPLKGWFNDEFTFSLSGPRLVGGNLAELNSPPDYKIGAFNVLLIDSK